MEPRIQYAKTKDGVSIAYYTLGAGTPLLITPNPPFSHIQLEWEWPECRVMTEGLAQNRMLVRYDHRGSGLSEHDVGDHCLDAHVLDVEAVVDRLGLDTFSLLGVVESGPVAVTYAARHPERISRLILWCAVPRLSDFLGTPFYQAIRALRGQDWETYTETIAHGAFGWSEPEQARRYAGLIRECITPEALPRFARALAEWNSTALLPRVRSPTLVLHRRQLPAPDVSVARGLASRIPEARLILLEGASLLPWVGDADTVLAAIDEFLPEGEEATRQGAAAEPSAFRTVLFTDVEGSTALTQRLGDAKARDLLREHERIVREALKSHGGSELKTMGDGFMASFSSATRALECSIAMQRAFAAHNETAAEPILVRVGLNAGEPIAEEEDLFGTAVIEAARIAAAAKGGQILVSNVVRELAKGKDFQFADRGEVALKGFDEPVRLFEVRWEV